MNKNKIAIVVIAVVSIVSLAIGMLPVINIDWTPIGETLLHIIS